MYFYFNYIPTVFNYNLILIILITIHTTTVLTTSDISRLKHRCILLPEDDQLVLPKYFGDLATNKKDYGAKCWF
jgi:hypothetical protein